MRKIWYPTSRTIITNNKKVLQIHKATKGDRHKITGRAKLEPIIQEAKQTKGSIERKAAVLLRGINHAHSFSSANKRTGYFTANQFICKNKGYLIAKKREKQREFCQKVRAGQVGDKEIAHWLKHTSK